MFVEGSIFKIDGKEYRLRFINKYQICWLEPVLRRDEAFCCTGGLNKIYRMDELQDLEYMELCY